MKFPRLAWSSASVDAEVTDVSQRPPVLSRLDRAFPGLLRLAGLTGRPGWRSALYAAVVYGVLTWSMVTSVQLQWQHGIGHLESRKNLYSAAAHSAFFGAIPVQEWVTVTVAFLIGRRKYAELLAQIPKLLEDAGELFQSKRATVGHNLGILGLWMLVTVLTVGSLIIAILNGGGIVACKALTGTCIVWMAEAVYFVCSLVIFQLIPLKFVFAGQLLARGFESVNAAIESMVGNEVGDVERQLKMVGDIQKRFASCFIKLTDAMTVELILAMFHGVLTMVSLMMNIINELNRETFISFIFEASMFLLVSVVTLAGPCEICQRLLALTGQRCDLLLELEWRRPQLEREAGLQRAAALRHLDTIGDLGLFQARHSTLLAASATIVTYVVILAQFQTSQEGCDCDGLLSSNGSEVM